MVALLRTAVNNAKTRSGENMLVNGFKISSDECSGFSRNFGIGVHFSNNSS